MLSCLCSFFENYLNLQIRRFHTWQAGHEGTHVTFLPKMINHTWQAMHRGTPQCEICDFLVGQHPEPFNNFREIGCAPMVLNDWSQNIAPGRERSQGSILC